MIIMKLSVIYVGYIKMRFIISFVTLSVCFPRLLCQLLMAFYQNKSIDVFSQAIVGKGMSCFTMKIITAGNKPLVNVDLWLHYLKGNIDFIGPKPMTHLELKNLAPKNKVRFDVNPGVISPFQVKKKSGIAYNSEMQESVDFATQAGWRRRLQIVLAYVLHLIMGNASKTLVQHKHFSLFGVSIQNVSMANAVNSIMRMTNKPRVKGALSQMSFVNADCVNKYIADENYQKILNGCHSVFADGIGMRIAARRHKSRLVDNVNGTDMLPLLCSQLEKKEKRVFLYGGSDLAVKKTVARLTKVYPKLKIAGYLDGYTYKNSLNVVCDEINQADTDVLLVALGAPRQEQWISDNAKNLDVSVAIGVGGLFDFYSGQVSRAPSWLREMSLEWVWRLLMQPKDKAKRYLIGNPLFLFRVLFSTSKCDQHSQLLEVS